MKIFGYLLIAFAGYIFMMNWQNVERQDRIIRGGVPTKVVILDKRVKKVAVGGSSNYAPSIVYAYTLGKSVYHSDRTLPIDQTRSDEHWADGMLSGYTVGKTYTGYYDPANYQKSFLVRRYTIAYYLPLFLSLVLFDLGILVLLSPFGKAAQILKPYPNWAGFYEVEPGANIRSKLIALQFCTAIWWFGSLFILCSYAFVAQPYLSNWFWIACAAAIAVGIYPTVSLFKTTRAAVAISNAVVLIDTPQVVLGHVYKLKILVFATKECALKTLQASILCRQVHSDSDGSQTTTLYEKELLSKQDKVKIRPREPLAIEETLCAPSAYPKTSDQSNSKIKWDIVIKLHTEDGGAVEQRYPFVVYASSEIAKK
jgi:hypothetical protein